MISIFVGHIVAFARDMRCVVYLGHLAFGKLDFDGGTGHLYYAALRYTVCRHKFLILKRQRR